jgi:hypothetical protein
LLTIERLLATCEQTQRRLRAGAVLIVRPEYAACLDSKRVASIVAGLQRQLTNQAALEQRLREAHAKYTALLTPADKQQMAKKKKQLEDVGVVVTTEQGDEPPFS